MASVRERPRKDGTICYAVLYTIDGRQSSLPFDDPKAAEAFRAAVNVHGAQRALEMHNIDAAPRRRNRATEMTVAQWVRHHIDHLTGVEQYTIDCYNRYLENDIKPFLGDIPLARLAEEDIARWVKHMETTPSKKTGRPAAPKTIRNKHGFLSGALAAAVPKHLPANPAAGRRLSRGDDEAETDMRMLSRAEFDRLLAASPEPWRPLIKFLVLSGCRWGEATALKPSDVDKDAGTVKIRRAWKYSSNGYTIGPTKTKRSRRTINLPARILGKLDYSGPWLFTDTGARAGRPVRYHLFKPQVWDRAVAAAKLDPKPTPHDLRHTCASWMLALGTPTTTVSRHLGHESIKITADVYGDVERSSFAAAAEAMGKLLD